MSKCRNCQTPVLTEAEQFTIAEALRHARKLYEHDAAQAREVAADARAEEHAPPWAGLSYERIAKQFDQQVEQCNALLKNQFEDSL